MKASELTTGRTFGVTFEHGEDFFSALKDFCVKHDMRQGYVPMFIGAFSQAEIVGACGPLTNPEAPVWERTSVQSVEALGGGTLAFDNETGSVSPHIHLAVGLKAASAEGRTSHLLSGTVQFLSELLIVEVTTPTMTRPRDHAMFDVPLLTFG
jgi:predicted DNA-binding protein with PD1-like motif